MTIAEFKSSVNGLSPPNNLAIELKSLWYDGNGDWEKSHDVIQDVNSGNAAWIHAYLHRKEGDVGNAKYWYAKAGRSMPSVGLDEEWEMLVVHFLKIS